MYIEVKVNPEIKEWEAKATQLVTEEKFSSRELAWCFEATLSSCFLTLPKGNYLRGWDIDDFLLDEAGKTCGKLSLSGIVYWLSGGGDCHYVRIDIATETNNLLYSYKFWKKLLGQQTLYVARTHQNWIVSDA